MWRFRTDELYLRQRTLLRTVCPVVGPASAGPAESRQSAANEGSAHPVALIRHSIPFVAKTEVQRERRPDLPIVFKERVPLIRNRCAAWRDLDLIHIEEFRGRRAVGSERLLNILQRTAECQQQVTHRVEVVA